MRTGHAPDCAMALNARHECTCGYTRHRRRMSHVRKPYALEIKSNEARINKGAGWTPFEEWTVLRRYEKKEQALQAYECARKGGYGNWHYSRIVGPDEEILCSNEPDMKLGITTREDVRPWDKPYHTENK